MTPKALSLLPRNQIAEKISYTPGKEMNWAWLNMTGTWQPQLRCRPFLAWWQVSLDCLVPDSPVYVSHRCSSQTCPIKKKSKWTHPGLDHCPTVGPHSTGSRRKGDSLTCWLFCSRVPAHLSGPLLLPEPFPQHTKATETINLVFQHDF